MITNLIHKNYFAGLVLLLSLGFFKPAYSQFTFYGVPHDVDEKKSSQGGRTKELEPMPLPFWDDFSFATEHYPHDTLWQFGKTVWVNNGTGINPPSLGVATFDGLDSLGNPYSVNDVLEKGIADRLVSCPISLDLVDPSERSTVFLSFYYQFRGNGEPPDPGDQLRVLFKNADDGWIQVHTIENDGSFDSNIFTQVLVQVSGDEYFHEDFQFSLQSYGRLSGPYDTWNVDYVYLNKGRSAADGSYTDRTITVPMTSMFNGYFSMPLDHFMEDPSNNRMAPMLSVHNLEVNPGADLQPLNYASFDSVYVYRDNAITKYFHELDDSTFYNTIPSLAFVSQPVANPPVTSDLTPLDSAATIKYKLWINSGDNVPDTEPNGDYNVAKYAPIDFRWNDTTRIEYRLSDYYAYDDGTAEYGAALNQPGAQLAYLFEMKTQQPDTIVALDLYFPKFGEEVPQSVQIQILRDLSGDPGSFLHTEFVTIKRNSQNVFWRWVPSRFVGVVDKFYVGWKQNTARVLAVGLDKSNDTSDKVFFNITGDWEQPTNLTGSLMIRPVFGKGDGIVTGLPGAEHTTVSFFPNPNRGSFTVTGNPDQIQVYDLAGKSVSFHTEEVQEGVRINLSHSSKGIYILRLISHGNISVHRIMVE